MALALHMIELFSTNTDDLTMDDAQPRCLILSNLVIILRFERLQFLLRSNPHRDQAERHVRRQHPVSSAHQVQRYDGLGPPCLQDTLQRNGIQHRSEQNEATPITFKRAEFAVSLSWTSASTKSLISHQSSLRPIHMNRLHLPNRSNIGASPCFVLDQPSVIKDTVLVGTKKSNP